MRGDPFWGMTPFELQVIADAEGERLEDRYRSELSVAWHGEAFARTKKLPSHNKIVARQKKDEAAKPQGVDEAALKLQFERHNRTQRMKREQLNGEAR